MVVSKEDNSGVLTDLAVERNRLAAERTFLSWIRTGLGGLGGGFAITRLVTFSTFTHQIAAYIVGQMFILWGVGLFIFALLEYQNTCKNLKIDYNQTFSFIKIRIIVFLLIFLSLMVLFLTT